MDVAATQLSRVTYKELLAPVPVASMLMMKIMVSIFFALGAAAFLAPVFGMRPQYGTNSYGPASEPYGAVGAIGFCVALFAVNMPPLMWIFSSSAVRNTNAEVTARTRRAMKEFAGKEFQYAHYSVAYTKATFWQRPRVAASAIGWDGEYLYVVDTGVVGKIPVDAIRRWEWKVINPDRMVLLGAAQQSFSMKMDVAQANGQQALNAYNASGLLVSVSDVTRPNWHFNIDDESVLRQWDEILTQITS